MEWIIKKEERRKKKEDCISMHHKEDWKEKYIVSICGLRAEFHPSKVEIRVRVPADALFINEEESRTKRINKPRKKEKKQTNKQGKKERRKEGKKETNKQRKKRKEKKRKETRKENK